MKKIINGHSQRHHWWQTLAEVILHFRDNPLMIQMKKRERTSLSETYTPEKKVRKKIRPRKRSRSGTGKKSHFSLTYTELQ